MSTWPAACAGCLYCGIIVLLTVTAGYTAAMTFILGAVVPAALVLGIDRLREKA